MFCGFGVEFMLVGIWHGGCTLAGKRCSYRSILVCGWRDMIPGVLSPYIVVLGEEPGSRGKTRCILRDDGDTFLEPKGGLGVCIS